MAELLKEVKLLRQDIHQPHGMNYHVRSYSAVEIRSSSPTNFVMEPEIYEEGQKSYQDVMGFLEAVSMMEENPTITSEEKEIISQIKTKYNESRRRLEWSLKRNKNKGAQIAHAEITPEPIDLRKRTDSGYGTSIRDVDLLDSNWSSSASSSRRLTNRSSTSQAWSWIDFPTSSSSAPSVASQSVASSSTSKTVTISVAKM